MPASLSYIARDRALTALERVVGSLPTDLTNASRLREDLGLDSLDHVEFVMELEKEFDIDITDEQAESLVTVGDAVRHAMLWSVPK